MKNKRGVGVCGKCGDVIECPECEDTIENPAKPLRSCPFCDMQPYTTIATDGDGEARVHSVQCLNCGQSDTGYWPTREAAGEAWNTRFK